MAWAGLNTLRCHCFFPSFLHLLEGFSHFLSFLQTCPFVPFSCQIQACTIPCLNYGSGLDSVASIYITSPICFLSWNHNHLSRLKLWTCHWYKLIIPDWASITFVIMFQLRPLLPDQPPLTYPSHTSPTTTCIPVLHKFMLQFLCTCYFPSQECTSPMLHSALFCDKLLLTPSTNITYISTYLISVYSKPNIHMIKLGPLYLS